MPYNRNEYDELVKNKKIKIDNIVSMETKRAAPQMEVLTNSEEWNKYLSYLEPLALKAEQAAIELTNQLMNPTLFDAEKLFYLKSEHIKMKERAEVIRAIMELPKEIIEFGKITSDPFKGKT